MSDLLIEGLTLAAYGMGTVFVFLTLLVGVTALMSVAVQRLNGNAGGIDGTGSTSLPAQANTRVKTGTGGEVEPKLLVAISAAVRAYRKDHEST